VDIKGTCSGYFATAAANMAKEASVVIDLVSFDGRASELVGL